MFSMDSLASLVGRIAWARAETAALERARTIANGDAAAAARAQGAQQGPPWEWVKPDPTWLRHYAAMLEDRAREEGRQTEGTADGEKAAGQ